MQDPAQEVVGDPREPHLVALVEEQVPFAVRVPHRHVGMAPVAGEVQERLRHEGGAKAMALRHRLHHEPEERVAVRGAETVGVLPVHLELAVRILVIVLVWVPAELLHVVANLADHVVAAHECRLVIAGLLLAVPSVGDLRAVLVDEEELALDSGPQPVTLLCRRLDLALEDDAGRRLDLATVHP